MNEEKMMMAMMHGLGMGVGGNVLVSGSSSDVRQVNNNPYAYDNPNASNPYVYDNPVWKKGNKYSPDGWRSPAHMEILNRKNKEWAQNRATWQGQQDADQAQIDELAGLKKQNAAMTAKNKKFAHSRKTSRVRDAQKKRQKLLGSRINQGRGTILTDQLGAQAKASSARKSLLGL